MHVGCRKPRGSIFSRLDCRATFARAPSYKGSTRLVMDEGPVHELLPTQGARCATRPSAGTRIRYRLRNRGASMKQKSVVAAGPLRCSWAGNDVSIRYHDDE